MILDGGGEPSSGLSAELCGCDAPFTHGASDVDQMTPAVSGRTSSHHPEWATRRRLLDPGDWLDDADRAAPHKALRDSNADVAAGRLVDAEEILKELRSR